MAEVDTIDVKDAAAATQTVATQSKVIKTIGVPGDAAWSSGDGTHTSILKTIVSWTSRIYSSTAPNTAGAATATTALAVAGTYLSTPPTLSNTNQVGLQVSSAGRLLTTEANSAAIKTDLDTLAAAVQPVGVQAASASTSITFASDEALKGQKAKTASLATVPASDWVYNTGKWVALPVSTTTTIQASTGAIGDYLDRVIVFPNTTAAGSIVIKDGATTVATYAGGGTTALLTLTPFVIAVGAVSSVGAWSAVVGANVHAVAVGRFS